MLCPYCGHESLTTADTRQVDGSSDWRVRRQRHCKDCKKAFATYEVLAEAYDPLRKAFAAVSGIAELVAAFQEGVLSKRQGGGGGPT